MYNLIRKDILLQINYFIVAIPISLIFVIAFTPTYPDFGYAMGAFAIAFILALTTPSLEAKNHCDIVLNSLPVLRREIIMSKYLSAMLYTCIALLMVILAGLLAKMLPLPRQIPYITWSNILNTFISISLMVSIYFPIFYKFYNNVVVLFLNIILFQLIFFMPSYVLDYLKYHINEPWIQQIIVFNAHNPWVLPLLGITAALLLLMISYRLTLKIYSAKDF